MILFIILAVLVEVLLALLLLMLAALGIATYYNRWRKTKEELAKESYCRFELEQIANQVVDYQKFPSLEKCQAVNIKINMWNAECNKGAPIATLDCTRHQ